MSYRFSFKKNSGPIKSIDKLCSALDITPDELTKALNLPQEDRYRVSTVPKANGSVRYIYNPHYLIRKIQRRINKRLFNPKTSNQGIGGGVILWPSYIFGCVPNEYDIDNNSFISKDYISCAKVHCGSKSILKLDISDFFNNVDVSIVQSIFRELLDYSESVVDVLSDICCYEKSLVQGGLTSSYLASLALYDVEPTIVKRLLKKGYRYTRLIDDITISSVRELQNFDFVEDIIVDMLHSKDLPVNREKTVKLYASSTPLMVHGLRVNYKEPRLPSDEVSRIRASVQNIEKLAKERHYRTIHPYRKDFNKCLGRVSKLKRVGHVDHVKLLKRLQKVIPLPSKQDIFRCEKMLNKLEADFKAGKNDSFWFFRRYHLASQRIMVINRTFKKEANELRARLKAINCRYSE